MVELLFSDTKYWCKSTLSPGTSGMPTIY